MENHLETLAYAPVRDTRVISAENPDGSKGGAARWIPDPSDPNLPYSGAAVRLGQGWKVRPFIKLPASTTVTLADVEGPGSINQLFITSDFEQWRGLVLRIWWDDEDDPSVECPLGDFFAIGHDGVSFQVRSLPVVVAPRRGCNSYWPMPFRKRARITLSNDTDADAHVIAYKILYHRQEVPPSARYLHAQWRRAVTKREHPEHTILDGVRGAGYYAGTYLAWTAFMPGWWGEGEVKFYIDGDGDFPSIADNGTEDYFGGAWGFYGDAGHEECFSAPYLGLTFAETGAGPRRFSLYRWHVLDRIGFGQDLRVTVQALGVSADEPYYQPLTDDIASVAVWYQTEPHAPFPELPDVKARTAR